MRAPVVATVLLIAAGVTARAAEVRWELGGRTMSLSLQTRAGDPRLYRIDGDLDLPGLEHHPACGTESGESVHHEECPTLLAFFREHGDAPGRVTIRAAAGDTPRQVEGGSPQRPGQAAYVHEGGFPVRRYGVYGGAYESVPYSQGYPYSYGHPYSYGYGPAWGYRGARRIAPWPAYGRYGLGISFGYGSFHFSSRFGGGYRHRHGHHYGRFHHAGHGRRSVHRGHGRTTHPPRGTRGAARTRRR